MFRSAVSFAAVVAGLSFLSGCAASAASGTAEGSSELSASDERSVRESFKLYTAPGVVPSLDCDVHTELTLSNIATLREVVGGVCEMYVEPNERSYRLELAGTDCGSIVYRAQTRVNGKDASIKITDHRGRTCRDVREADIVVEEIGIVEGPAQRLFSL